MGMSIMGMRYYAHLAFGIKLPEEFNIGDDDDVTPWEALDNLFNPYDERQPYPLLELVEFGTYDDPEFVIACKSHIHSVCWTAKPIKLESLDINFNELSELGQFATDFDIDAVARWYLGVYMSY